LLSELVILTGLLITAPVLAADSGVIAGPAERRAEEAAAAASRAKDATEKLHATEPAPHDRRARPAYDDALERAERAEQRAIDRAADAAREAERAARQAESAARDRSRLEQRDERLKRWQRERDDKARQQR